MINSLINISLQNREAVRILKEQNPREKEAFYEAITNIRILADNILKEADWIDINQKSND